MDQFDRVRKEYKTENTKAWQLTGISAVVVHDKVEVWT